MIPLDKSILKAAIRSLSNIGQLNGFGEEVNIWTLSIPQNSDDFREFCRQMNENEKAIIELVEKQEW